MPDGLNHTPKLNSPLAVYQSQLGSKLVEDPSQLQAIMALDTLFWKLSRQNTISSEPIKGLYLWGDVGRGKTFLMDLFYDCLPQKGKLRLHFHRFMARIHHALKEQSGQQDPLVIVAKDLAKECRILCFDEFFVSDIGDAMILAGLFACLFEQGVVLVATSNIPIERLYENGLARHKFLPCIALLQQHTQLLHLSGEQDHRLHHLLADQNETAFIAASKYVGNTLDMDFAAIFAEQTQVTNPEKINTSSIKICHRDIKVISATDINISNSVVWFDFYDLCEGPRSQLDYMEIATSFNIIILSGVPQLGGQIRGWIKARGTEDGVGDNQATVTGERTLSYAVNDDMARRFISLIDELYDQKVRLYLGSDVPIAELYLEGALIFEFRRTYSRLIEMSHN
ncbi:cell division protein ZapE [Paraglaciecola arctica]|uniref:AFG1 family ATPase n=1 Tax=Paraglaciecola arctica BSs20135 TaxID=493475 RepID=K6YSK4_9ALTE|nr:cell division protein ZapE [Paraglaciecola arctica]GAC19673.1 AFG1 family ATPase [Paraglaciecola arctica BSs20135]